MTSLDIKTNECARDAEKLADRARFRNIWNEGAHITLLRLGLRLLAVLGSMSDSLL